MKTFIFFHKRVQQITFSKNFNTFYLLYKMEKVGSMSCTFCEIHQENILHLVWSCQEVRTIWIFGINTLNKIEPNTINIQCKDVLFGYGFESKEWKKYKLINSIILYIKNKRVSEREREIVCAYVCVCVFCV